MSSETRETTSTSPAADGDSPVGLGVQEAVTGTSPLDTPHHQIAANTRRFGTYTASLVAIWWAATTLLLPRLAEIAGRGLWAGVSFYVWLLPALAVCSGTLAAFHGAWYAWDRWHANASLEFGGET